MDVIAKPGPGWPAYQPATGQPPLAGRRSAPFDDIRRWHAFATMAADFLFETDRGGTLTFVAPATVLGWPASELLGRPLRSLLLDASGRGPLDIPIAPGRHNVWLRTRSGEALCMTLTLTPLLDATGSQQGMRGVAVDVTDQELEQARASSATHRANVLEQMLERLRHESAAPHMMGDALQAMLQALVADGAAVLDVSHDEFAPVLLCRAGDRTDPASLLAQVAVDAESVQTILSADGRPVLSCPASTRFGDRAVLLLWRDCAKPAWSAEDVLLAGAVAGVVRIILEHESIQRELARQTRTDALTGLLNRRAFIEQASRRLDRLEAEGLPASVLFIDLDGLQRLNDRAGHETGDDALLLTSALLRRTLRPTDLVARLGADEFACWLDGADTFTAAERAEGLRQTVPQEFGHYNAGEAVGLGMSIGIAMRRPGSDETLEQLLQRAELAMVNVKQNGCGHWRVSQLPPTAG